MSIPLRKSYEITGYIVSINGTDNTIFCVECFKNNMPIGAETPIFLDSEWDYQPTCDYCNEKIEVSII